MALEAKINEVHLRKDPTSPLILRIDVSDETGRKLEWYIPKNEIATPFLEGLKMACKLSFGQDIQIPELQASL